MSPPKLPIKDLAKRTICDGHLYLTSGKRKFYVMKPGIFIDQAFIKKHAATNQVFEFEIVVNEAVKDRFKVLFKELQYLQFERDLRQKSIEILTYFEESFSGSEHFLTFASACHDVFCKLPHEVQQRLHDTDLHLYRKGLYASAFGIITALCNNYHNFLMLRDFYHLTFVLDLGLCCEDYSYFVSEACNHENRKPGSGITYLETEGASELEIAAFLEHPEKSYSAIFDSELLAYPELAEIVRYQHELSDGSGFPRGIKKGQISSWEAVVIFSDSLVEIIPNYGFEEGVLDYLMGYQSQKLAELPVQRVFDKVRRAFKHLKEEKEAAS